jgi:hypothetical protein
MFAAAADSAAFGGLDGFLGTRASIGMDVVLVGLWLLLPVLAWSIMLVRRGRYATHKLLQLVIAGRLGYFKRNLEEGTFLSAKTAAKAYPFVEVLRTAA